MNNKELIQLGMKICGLRATISAYIMAGWKGHHIEWREKELAELLKKAKEVSGFDFSKK